MGRRAGRGPCRRLEPVRPECQRRDPDFTAEPALGGGHRRSDLLAPRERPGRCRQRLDGVGPGSPGTRASPGGDPVNASWRFAALVLGVWLLARSEALASDARRPPGVQVKPDGSWASERTPSTNGYSATFTVKNTQTSTQTFCLTRESSANITTTG